MNASYFQVFDKLGNEVGGPVDFNTLWAPLGFTSAGDPVILYDQEYDRWIITEFPSGNQLLVAISETSDPLGSYMAYNFATPRFPDYPKYGLWKNTLYVTTNESGASVHHTYFLDRAALINGDATVRIQRIEIPGVNNAPGFMVATPVDWSGSTDPHPDALPMVMYIQDDAWGEVAQDEIEIFSFDVDFDNEANTIVNQFSLPTAAFDAAACADYGPGFACIPQPNSTGLDGIPWVIMNQTHYRNFGTHESMVLNFLVDYTGSENPIGGIRWMELRRADPGVEWTVYQEGTFAPEDGLHRFMGAIAMDGVGNIGLAYNVSSETEFAGLRFTGRRANDPLGVMTVEEYNLATGLSETSDDRFGDYATMSVDPIDDRTFWFTGEYMKDNNRWGTKVVAFNLFRDTVDIGPIQAIAPTSGPALSDMETAIVVIKNFGLDTINNFMIGYQLDSETPVLEMVPDTILPDSTLVFQFSSPLDLTVPGRHTLRYFTELTDDSNPSNDNLVSHPTHVPLLDASILGVAQFESFICGSDAEVTIELANLGIDTLASVTVDIYLDNVISESINWTGSLLQNQSQIISSSLTGLPPGGSDLKIISSTPNGGIDQIPMNDTFSILLTSAPSNQTTTLEIIPDRFPDEITWQVTDVNSIVLFSGGPYSSSDSVISESWCLAPECHTFTIFDAADDGICCGFGNGSYQIIDPSGNVLVNSDGTYGAQESFSFCIDSCVIIAELDMTPVSAAGAMDGAVRIAASNGNTPYRFSIDGGNNYQFANLFTDLPAGEYYVAVRDRDDCVYRDTFLLTTCDMEVVVTTLDESEVGAQDGSISFLVQGGTPPFEFSIDGGLTSQLDTIFDSLSATDYMVLVSDSNGCLFSELVTVDVNVSTRSVSLGHAILVYPNPTDGVLLLEVRGATDQKLFLPFEVYDGPGKLIYASNLVNYSNVFKGEVTLQGYPSGTYYLIFPGDEIHRMTRILKQ